MLLVKSFYSGVLQILTLSLFLSSCTLIGTGVGLSEASKGYGYGHDLTYAKGRDITVTLNDSSIVSGIYKGDTLLSESEYTPMYDSFLTSHPNSLFPALHSEIEYQLHDWGRQKGLFNGFGYNGLIIGKQYISYSAVRHIKTDSAIFNDYDFEVIRSDHTVPLVSGFLIKDSIQTHVVWNSDIRDLHISDWVGNRVLIGTLAGLAVDVVMLLVVIPPMYAH